MEAIVNAVTSGITNVYNFLVNLNDNIANWIVDCVESIGEFFGNVGTWIGELGTDIGGWFGSLGDNLGQWLSYLNPFDENFFGNKLIELLSQALSYLFTPSQDILTNLQTTVSGKFGFIDSIQTAKEEIQDMLENIENGTAKLTVDIDSEFYDGEVTVVDFAWYSKFKTYGDMIFTGFAYVLFFWRLYKAVPSILSGFSSASSSITRGGGDD